MPSRPEIVAAYPVKPAAGLLLAARAWHDEQATINRINMYKAKGIRDKKGKLIGGAYMMNNRAGDQAITTETGAFA